MQVYPSCQAQLELLLADKAPTKISPEYSNYAENFLFNHSIELPKNIGINEYIIELLEDKQLPYEPIYSLKPVELEILKIYIETHLKTGLIWLSKSPAGVFILFDQKLDESLCLCVNYQDLNNLTIKNWYLFRLIGKALERLGRAKCFTQLHLTNAYHKMRIWEDNE